MQGPNMMLRRRSMNWRKLTKAPTQTWMKAKLVSLPQDQEQPEACCMLAVACCCWTWRLGDLDT
uniref:Uncharacterized protein n=1 Tax=Setaria viridis TaxID=4556 RepID=A0A4U6V1Z3_SETVI|nr:hypothetical protein SEVIR_4G269300v2 [Setaria viridis]